MKAARLKIASTIARRVKEEGLSPELSRSVAAYLLDTGRTDELDSIMRDVQQIWADGGYVDVKASSSHLLTNEIRAQIEQEVSAHYPNVKEVIINEVIDPNLIGGVRLNFANQQLDLSFETKLNKFRQLTKSGKD